MPASGNVNQIRTNVNALNALNALQNVNNQLTVHNLRLATGKRINSAADDPSGLTLASSLDLRARKLGASINNIGDAQNVLAIAEGGLSNMNKLLAQIVEKIMQAASDTQGPSEKSAIFQELNQLGEELDFVAAQTQFNGVVLLTSATLTFQTGPDGVDTNRFGLTHAYTSAALGISSLTVASQALASMSLGSVTAAITSVKTALQNVGAILERLNVKADNLTVAKLNNVFEPFSSSKSITAGLGLGLPIVRDIVTRHGGRVSLASSPAGTTVTLSFEPSGAAERHAGRRRVLLVDDHDDVRATFQAMLADAGWEVTAAASAEEALRALDEQEVDALLVDVQMSGRDGLALLEALALWHPTLVPRVTLHTGYADEPRVREAAGRHGVTVLEKPCRLHRAARRPRASRRHAARHARLSPSARCARQEARSGSLPLVRAPSSATRRLTWST